MSVSGGGGTVGIETAGGAVEADRGGFVSDVVVEGRVREGANGGDCGIGHEHR